MTQNSFYKAVKEYGELEHNEIMEITNGEPIIINGKEVDSILDDDGLKFAYIGEDGSAYERSLYIDDIDKDVRKKLYDYLKDNRNTNTEFFNSLPR